MEVEKGCRYEAIVCIIVIITSAVAYVMDCSDWVKVPKIETTCTLIPSHSEADDSWRTTNDHLTV